MIEVAIPGWGEVQIHNLVLDFNGTIAKDGLLLPGVGRRIEEIAKHGVAVYVITADTNGSVARQCKGLPLQIEIYENSTVAENKKALVQRLGADCTVAIGNGRNDVKMLEESELSIAVLGDEGCYSKSAVAADLICRDILDALDLLLLPNRLKASLRG